MKRRSNQRKKKRVRCVRCCMKVPCPLLDIQVSKLGKAMIYVQNHLSYLPVFRSMMRLLQCNLTKDANAQGYKLTSKTKLTSLTAGPAKSSNTGIKSTSSLSCASENQLEMGTAC
jgi:hypothetical protein